MNAVRACPWRGGVRRPDPLPRPVGRHALPGTHHGRGPYSCPLQEAVPACPLKGQLGWAGPLRGGTVWGCEAGQLTGEEEPELPAEALGDALQHQLPRSGCAVHAHAAPELEEVDVPRLLFHLLLGLGEQQSGVCSASSAPPPRAGVLLARHCPGVPGTPRAGGSPRSAAPVRQDVPGHCAGPPEGRRPSHPRHARACTAVGLPVCAYPLGAQVLHGRISLEELEQPLGGGWRLLCTAPLEATEG